jgi:aspartyl-tRNA(Asn)/glutamyl-tRNA(Gln) amidotransferase subunit A
MSTAPVSAAVGPMGNVGISLPPGHRDTASVIAADVRSGARSAVAVLAEHFDRIDASETDVHAFNYVMRAEAQAAAEAVDAAVASGRDPGVLAGVPLALKDNMCTKGIPTTCSSKILEGWEPPYNATVVDRLAAAGALFVGKCNLDEFAMGSSTENSAFGPTRNPHDFTKVPGGSSGGSAAAVAAGYAAVSLGSDTGGSIRQPASLCGLVGVKPTYGLVSRFGLIAFASSLDQIGPFSHTVADAALLLEAISGHDPMDSTSYNAPAPSLQAAVADGIANGVAGLRVGIVTELAGEGMSPDVLARLEVAAQRLRDAGATVGHVSVPSTKFGLSAYYLIAPAECSSNLARYDGVRYGLRIKGESTANLQDMMSSSRAAGFGPEVKRRIMLGTYALSAGYYDAYYGQAQKVRTLIIQDFAQAYAQFDVLLTPTSPTTAFAFGDKTADPMTMYFNDVATIPSNLSGDPALSVPCGVGDDGMPIGVQLLGPKLSEATLLKAAAVIEKGNWP